MESTVKQYVHKPTEIHAIQLTPESFEECIDFVGEQNTNDGTSKSECFIGLVSEEEDRSIREGDYIIRGVLGVFYPCSEKVFKESYSIKE